MVRLKVLRGRGEGFRIMICHGPLLGLFAADREEFLEDTHGWLIGVSSSLIPVAQTGRLRVGR
jgi:hypothetical protein